jgi:hypothetical protein
MDFIGSFSATGRHSDSEYIGFNIEATLPIKVILFKENAEIPIIRVYIDGKIKDIKQTNRENQYPMPLIFDGAVGSRAVGSKKTKFRLNHHRSLEKVIKQYFETLNDSKITNINPQNQNLSYMTTTEGDSINEEHNTTEEDSIYEEPDTTDEGNIIEEPPNVITFDVKLLVMGYKNFGEIHDHVYIEDIEFKKSDYIKDLKTSNVVLRDHNITSDNRIITYYPNAKFGQRKVIVDYDNLSEFIGNNRVIFNINKNKQYTARVGKWKEGGKSYRKKMRHPHKKSVKKHHKKTHRKLKNKHNKSHKKH